MAAWNTYQKKAFQYLLLLFVAIIAINFIANKQFYRWDLTKEKRYTLSPATKQLLKDLDKQIEVEVYLDGKNLPAGIKKLKQSTKELLNEFRALSKGFVSYRFVDLNAIDDETLRKQIEENLAQSGIFPTNLNVKETSVSSQQLIYPGALFSNGQRNIGVEILENQMAFNTQDVLNNSYNFLEFKFANTIKKLMQERQHRIGILEGHGEPGSKTMSDLAQQLFAQDYMVRRIDLNKQSLFGAENYPDILMIPKPTQAFPEEHKFEIDQYIMHGGKVIWMLDKVIADVDSFRRNPQYLAIEQPLNLDDQLFRYGARVNADLVQDVYANPVPVTEGIGGGKTKTNLYPWVFHPIVYANNNHPIGKRLDPIALEFPNSLDTIRVQHVKKTILLSSSEATRISKAPVPLELGIAKVEPKPEYFTKSEVPLAVLLEGDFRSLYDNSLTKAFMEDLQKWQIEFKSVSEPTKQIVIADGDIALNDISVGGVPSPLGYNKYTRQTFANRAFMMNCIEFLMDDNELILSRNKETKMQLLDEPKVKDMQGLWQVLNIAVPLAFMFLVGGVIRWRRRRFVD